MITRKQLKEFGASDYLARCLTKDLQPVGRRGRAYLYSRDQVLDVICRRMNAPRIRQTTKIVLTQLEIEVSKVVEDAITDNRLLAAIQEATEANARFEQTARSSRQVAEDFQAYKEKHQLQLNPQNNIVVFAG